MKTLSLLAALLLCSTVSAQQFGFQQFGGAQGPVVVQVQRQPRIIRLPMIIPTPYYQATPQRPTVTYSKTYTPPAPAAKPLVIDNPYFVPGVTK